MEKVVLVTGASRGIGRAIAKLLAENDFKVVANYHNSEQAAIDLKQYLHNEGYEIEIFKADISKRDEIKKMIDFTIEKFGRIDVLVNNAGIDQEKMFQDISDEDWKKIIDVDLYSVFATTQEVVSNMINNKSGAIVNISSCYGVNGGSFAVAYSAAKAGVIGLTKSLAKELGPSNIRVNAIAPGCINTDMNSHLTKEEFDQIIDDTPLGRLGEGIDIARCVKWLAEDEFTTGQVISIDGGWR